VIPELADRADSLTAERQRPEVKPDGLTVEDLLGDLVAALHRLYTTDPDERTNFS
jgi:hypothetical protein